MRFNVENTVCISGKVAEVGAKNNRWCSFSTMRYYCIIVNEFSSQFFSLSAAYQKKSHDAQKRLSALDSVYIFARFRSLYCNGLFWALWTLRPLPTSFYSLFSISFLQTNGMSGRKTAGIRGHCRQENL